MNRNFQRLSRWALALPLLVTLSGCVATEADTVSDPVVTFPTWSAEHNQEGSVFVAAPAGWTVSRVEYSLDGTNWLQAKPVAAPATTAGNTTTTAGSGYTVALSNLDIGNNTLTLRVTSTYRDQTQVSLFYSVISGVTAVFNCETPLASMLPEPRLIRNYDTESRTMKGYFGDPTLHAMTFTIGFMSQSGNAYQSVGTISNYGREAITASFSVSHATCDTGIGTPNRHDCDVPYSLEVRVDGTVLCNSLNFGNIHTYWDGN